MAFSLTHYFQSESVPLCDRAPELVLFLHLALLASCQRDSVFAESGTTSVADTQPWRLTLVLRRKWISSRWEPGTGEDGRVSACAHTHACFVGS